MANVSEAFSKTYQSLTDDELLGIALKRQDLAEEAAAALDAELAIRHLGEDALREYERWMRAAEVEEEAGAEPEQEELDVAADASAELPPDWFDTRADAAVITHVSARPKGVTVGAMLFWLSGILGIGIGIVGLSGRPTLMAIFMGYFPLLEGVTLFAVGVALWLMKLWARKAAEVVCWINVVIMALLICVAGVLRLRGYEVQLTEALGYISGFLWNVLWAIYFGRADTRKAFEKASLNT